MSEEKKRPKHIVVCTKLDTIREEIQENADPNHEDFWPVSNFPKEIVPGKSRLVLADSESREMKASFLISGTEIRDWKGKPTKVVTLAKNSAILEAGKITKCAIRGGFRYKEKEE